MTALKRVLLTTIGSRGDVQPVVALAVRLKDLGHEVRVCAPPDFREWIEGLGIACAPMGPELRSTGKASPTAAPPTPEQRRRMVADSVAAQFEALTAAAEGCDAIVACGYLVVAARTVAEHKGIRYVWAGYCPIVLPSPHHAPPVFPALGDNPENTATDNSALWDRDAYRYEIFGEALNTHRASLGMPPVEDVRSHLFTDTPWLAADPALAPSADLDVFQPGAWILPDDRPLSTELAEFLDAGEPPLYFGFGSVRAPAELSRSMIESARALGRRAVVLCGWADLALLDKAPYCLSIGEVNQQELFKRVAAVVHHGGAGTTTATTRAGAPQVVIPQSFDQFYFAQRVQALGIGAAHAHAAPTTDSLTEALRHALKPEIATRAEAVAEAVRTDGVDAAARRLIN